MDKRLGTSGVPEQHLHRNHHQHQYHRHRSLHQLNHQTLESTSPPVASISSSVSGSLHSRSPSRTRPSFCSVSFLSHSHLSLSGPLDSSLPARFLPLWFFISFFIIFISPFSVRSLYPALLFSYASLSRRDVHHVSPFSPLVSVITSFSSSPRGCPSYALLFSYEVRRVSAA